MEARETSGRCGPQIQAQTRSRDEIQGPVMRVIRSSISIPKAAIQNLEARVPSPGTCGSHTNVTLFFLNRNRCAHMRAAFLAWIFMPRHWTSRAGSAGPPSRSPFRIIVTPSHPCPNEPGPRARPLKHSPLVLLHVRHRSQESFYAGDAGPEMVQGGGRVLYRSLPVGDNGSFC